MSDTEHASFRLHELKFATATRTFTGYGAVFGNTDAHGDVIVKGAFVATLREHAAAGTMPAMLGQHGEPFGIGPNQMPIGVWTSMVEDEHGLKVEGRLSETSRGNEAYVLLRDGALTGLSIGYHARHHDRLPGGKGRRLTDIKLLEVSLVTFPSNEQARITSVKTGRRFTRRDGIDALQAAGWPKSLAKAAMAGWRVEAEQEADSEAANELVEAAKARADSLSRLIKRIS